MTAAHFACAAVNFVCFLGFVTAILIITSHAPDGGRGAKRRGYARRALAFAG
jgi:hypothetical protein